jgi:hypothetical protein
VLRAIHSAANAVACFFQMRARDCQLDLAQGSRSWEPIRLSTRLVRVEPVALIHCVECEARWLPADGEALVGLRHRRRAAREYIVFFSFVSSLLSTRREGISNAVAPR